MVFSAGSVAFLLASLSHAISSALISMTSETKSYPLFSVADLALFAVSPPLLSAVPLSLQAIENRTQAMQVICFMQLTFILSDLRK
jgi:hypothetical protein